MTVLFIIILLYIIICNVHIYVDLLLYRLCQILHSLPHLLHHLLKFHQVELIFFTSGSSWLYNREMYDD